MADDWARLERQARGWALADPDPETAAALLHAVESGDEAYVRSCFAVPLEFGTAGLRGAVGPGPAHLCLALVLRLGWAVGRYLKGQGLQVRGVVVGYDARPDSERFARALSESLGRTGQYGSLSRS